MEGFSKLLNDMLMSVYHNIMRVEEEFLQNSERLNLTIREMHLIECVGEGDEEGKMVSEIAEFLKVAKPSVTVAVRKLEKKGYLARNGCSSDGRIVRITLTREGKKVFRYHMRYHLGMAREIEKDLQDCEKQLLIKTIGKLNKFFEMSVGAKNEL